MDTLTLAPSFNISETAMIRLGMRKTDRSLRVRVMLTDGVGLIMRGHTLSIGTDRLVVSVPTMVQPGLDCSVFFAVTLDGETCTVVGSGRVVACFPNPKGAFNAKLDFAAEDTETLERVVAEGE